MKTHSKVFCKRLHEALKDEHKAPVDYQRLKKVAPTQSIKNKITRIQKEEREHFRTLRQIRSSIHIQGGGNKHA